MTESGEGDQVVVSRKMLVQQYRERCQQVQYGWNVRLEDGDDYAHVTLDD
jgi:hypothetical protein